ncbi:Sedlin [Fistulina hepatica ATCC 64428]|uniref:Sedlin n=1 Tax=Fistulina hepatica ATCC 64428 TaxID=1128425 RepID=A0A0D7A6U0_9AGAR|nr:Sedlin [Fistulina hepatica ATCC 64428]
MSHHFFVFSPSDTSLYACTHFSTRPSNAASSALASNLPAWPTFAGTLTALSGAGSASHNTVGSTTPRGGGQDRSTIHMIANAGLDAIENAMLKENAIYLKSVDQFNQWKISAFVTPGNTKLVLLHEGRNDDGIRSFFAEAWELYVKTMLNPFHTAHTPIRSPTFDSRVQASMKKWL